MWKRNELPAKPGVLSLDETVKIYLEFLDAAPKTHLDAGEIEAVRKACAEVLERVKPLASKRGRKENVNFYLFMEALFKLAQESGAEVTLPSRQTKGKFGAQDRTAFFHFVRGTLELAIQKGRAAIERADLPAPEKEAALRRLVHTRKTDGGILEDLYSIRKSARSRRKKGSPTKDSRVPDAPAARSSDARLTRRSRK
jgi:hypothetical protein